MLILLNFNAIESEIELSQEFGEKFNSNALYRTISTQIVNFSYMYLAYKILRNFN